MTTELPSTTAPGTIEPHAEAPPGPVVTPTRIGIVGSGLVLGSLLVAAMLIWRPWGERDEFGYDAVQPIRGDAWTGTLVDSFGLALVAITVSVATCVLVRGRGRRWADVGAVVTTVGGIAFAMGGFARGAVGWLATADQVPASGGAEVLRLVEDEPMHLMAVAMAGFLLFTLGTLALAVAWWRSAAVPRWLPITLIVLTVGQFSGINDRPLDVLQVVVMGVFVCFGGFFLTRTAD